MSVRRTRRSPIKPRIEALEGRLFLAAQPVISEFMASNSNSLVDEDGDNSDWIEIENRGDAAIDLAGWHLTDEPDNLNKWEFPSVVLGAGEFLIVFASNKDRAVAGSQLHADFELAAGGEYLALVAPDAATIATEFSPAYPPQATDISYGGSPQPTFSTLLPTGAASRVLVPTNDALGLTWKDPAFADGAWPAAATGIGFDTAGSYDSLFGAGGDIEAAMHGQNSTAYIRTPFNVANPNDADVLRFQVKYDDGFIAYLNGTEIARRNAPSSVPPANLAPAGTSTGSSEGWGSVFKDGNDGNRDGTWTNGSVWHSTGTPETNPPSYYEIDLGEDVYLDRLQIFPRTDAAQSSVQNFRISIVDSDGTQVFLRDYLAGDSTRDKPWATNDVRNVLGQKVRIQRINQVEPNFLVFAEFEVWGRPAPVDVNLAQGKPVTASPALAGTSAARANDGNLDGHAARSPSPVYRSAAAGIGQFWQVDLGETQPLEYVNLFARTDAVTTGSVQLQVLDAAQLPVYTTTLNLGGTDFGGQRYDVVHDLPANTSGRYVKIATLANTELALAEVEVFGPTRAATSLDLADMVGGGDGTGSGIAAGISVVTGEPTNVPRGSIAGGPVNIYHPVAAHPFIDGVVVPDGGTGATTPVPVTSTGVMAVGISDTNGASWDEIWNGDNTGVSGGPATTSRLGMHASKGITFDLDAIEAANPGKSAAVFRTIAATGNCAGASTDMYVLLDGAIVDSTSLNGVNQASQRTVPIGPNNRFLTLITSSRGADNCDWSFFGNPTLDLIDPSSAGGGSSGFDARATVDRPDSQATQFESIDISQYRNLLVAGTNVLAIHGLNSSVNDGDFLIVPQIEAASLDSASSYVDAFLLTPTPGSLNGGPTAGLGPAITGVSQYPARPAAGQAMHVWATVTPKIDATTSVQLHYRTMFGAETTLTMFDDGLHDDGAAGDHVYGATIPAGAAAAGQMLRYYISTSDAAGRNARAPANLDRVGTKQSPEYYGTVVANPGVSTQLPVIEWFAQNPAAAHTRAGSRGSLFYDGEFYDNIFIRERGAFTVGGSQKFVFNKGYGFEFDDAIGRVEEFNLNTAGSDRSYLRQSLAFEVYRDAGVPSPESFLTYVTVNGSFDRVGIFIEQVDADLLERFGVDPEGALYKLTSSPNPAYSTGTVAEKKTRTNENNADFLALVAGLNLSTTTQMPQLTRFVMDNFDLPALINYLAARTIVQDIDDTRKNHYVYRDSNGSGLWSMMPWDKDWTFGEVGLGGTVVADRDDEVATGNANINFASHPFIGDSTHMLYQVQWSKLLDVIHAVPETREMYVRRLRTLMDELLQPPGTPVAERQFENRVDAMFAPAAPHLPAAVATAVANLKNQYFEPRRIYLYETHNIDNAGGGAASTTLIPARSSGVKYFIPTGTTPSTAQWTAFDFVDTAWSNGTFGIGYERSPGDAVNFTGLLSTSIDAAMTGLTSFYTRKRFNVASLGAVRDLTLKVKYDDGFVAYLNGVEVARRNLTGTPAYNAVAGNHDDNAAVVFESIVISKSALRQGDNVLAIHVLNAGATSSDLLLDYELIEGQAATTDVGIPHGQVGNPTITFGDIEFNPASGNQDEEYIELVNSNATSVDISGWQLTGGVEHTFDKGTVIPAGESLYVSPRQVAFRARTTGPSGNQGLFIQGNYNGHISSFGETIDLVAPDGSTVSTVSTPSVPTVNQLHLRVTEVMYHPADPSEDELALGFDDGDLFEFIELQNTSATEALELAGVEFNRGITFTFGDVSLAPGAYAVLVSNAAAFAARYPGVTIAGVYSGNLSNGGEALKLDDADGSTIHEFEYDDTGETWHPTTDGGGPSLVIGNTALPPDSWNDGASWQPSAAIGGSPGRSDSLPGDFNGDGLVGVADLAILQARLGTASEATLLSGDMNGDGAVNRLDVAAFVGQFGRGLANGGGSPAAQGSAAAESIVRRPAAQARVTAVRRMGRAEIVDQVHSVDDVDYTLGVGRRPGGVRSNQRGTTVRR